MKRQIDANTRLTLGLYLPAFGVAIKLQRKLKFGWVTTSWNYPIAFNGKDLKYILNWLLWAEKKKKTDYQVFQEMFKNSEI